MGNNAVIDREDEYSGSGSGHPLTGSGQDDAGDETHRGNLLYLSSFLMIYSSML